MSSPPETEGETEGETETAPHNGRTHDVLEDQGPEALTRFQYDCLLEIGATAPVIGLDIKRRLEEYYGQEVNHGRLYPNLDSLVDAGLVEKREADGRSNHYRLTADGQRVVHDRVAHVTARRDRLDAGEDEDA